METQEREEFNNYGDFPHEELMDELGVKVSDLSTATQREISHFEQTYHDAFFDGQLSQAEKEQLHTDSLSICERIKKEANVDNTSGIIVGLASGILGAFLGIKLARS